MSGSLQGMNGSLQGVNGLLQGVSYSHNYLNFNNL